jgi:fido (protein-threonine AMPylation protein)
MGWRCHGCGVLRGDTKIRRSSAPFVCTRTSRLCELFDATIIDHRPFLTIEQYCEIDRVALVDYVAAINETSQEDFPRSPDAFAELLKRLHRRVFERAIPSIAGVFRVGPVYFGGQHHPFEGCPWIDIEHQLVRLFAKCGLERTDFANVPRGYFVRTVAVFLEAFFMIHPFADGNGRVARLFTSIMCHHSKRWAFKASRGEGNHSERRKYDRALTWAHEALDQGEQPARRPRWHPYFLLEDWIQSRLTEVLPDSALVEEPPDPPVRRSSVPPPPDDDFVL